ncbi:MAG: SDR family NAD(P)-dependent oxidoreductase, partial [Devosia sp.]|nr:SDR family NAD(P)-dependent oxidoreductase [Devosia sp.]
MTRHPAPPFLPQHHPKPGLESALRPRPRYEAPDYRPAGKLRGRVALITGGDSGIGRAVALMFAREGADVAINHLPEEVSDAEATRDAIEGVGQTAILLPGSLADPAVSARIVDDTVRHFGRLDILVNNAAYQQHQETIEDLSDEQVAHTFTINVLATYRTTRAALRHLPRGGVIINTGSVTGLEGSAGLLDYS